MASLQDIGLGEYEARVYRTLLSIGPATAKELSRRSDVPMGRIYDVLADLEGSDLVRSQSEGRPTTYAPMDPEVALDRLVEAKRERLDAEFQQFERSAEELRDRLDSPAAGQEPFWTTAVGPEETVSLLVERLSCATDRIVLVASQPSMQLDLGEVGDRILDELEEALAGDVRVSILVSPDLLKALPTDLRRRYQRSLANRPNFEIRAAAEPIAGTFDIIDRTEVCIEVPNPLSPGEAFGLVDLADPTFAEEVYAEFKPRWDRAESATAAVPLGG